MKRIRKPIYIAAGYNTISLGSGRKEFNPKKERPSLEDYIKEAGKGALSQINSTENIDEAVISNFMAARFQKQGNLAGFIPFIDDKLKFKPCTRVEGACGSGGLGLATAAKTVLSDLSDATLVVGTEVQNGVKAIYGADILASAGHFAGERKEGHAFFFPGKFSDRAGAYFQKYGREKTRQAMARWYEQMILNARKNPKAQEFHNSIENLYETALMEPNPKNFVDFLNVFDCSKVSDGASSCVILSKEGLEKAGIKKGTYAEIVGIGQCEDDITKLPSDLTFLETTAKAAENALKMADIKISDLGFVEIHDCFTITAVIAMEALGLTARGKGADFILEGNTTLTGKIPVNATGGLIGFGHYTGGTGIRQAVDIMHQLTGQAGNNQLKLNKPFGMMISMGGNDKTVVAMVFKKIS